MHLVILIFRLLNGLIKDKKLPVKADKSVPSTSLAVVIMSFVLSNNIIKAPTRSKC